MRCGFAFILMVMISHGLTNAGEKSPSEQQALAQALGQKVQQFEMWTDDEGHVTGLIFINHQALNKSVGEKPGLSDADLSQLIHFPRLRALNLEAQPVSDQGLKILEKFPDLRQVGFHYMAKAKEAAASPKFISVIAGMQKLEILEIKHNFRMDAIQVENLQGPFPNVWRLVLDTPLNAEQTMHLISRCPNVTDLQLHRTEVSPDQLARIGKLLPNLEVLWFKPKGPLKAGHLQALKDFQQLRIFSPQHFKNRLPFTGGWDALVDLPSLERLEIAGQAVSANEPELKSLKTQRPKLAIDSKLTRSRICQGL